MSRFFLLLIILTPLLIFSQNNNHPTYTISGKIIDTSTKLPLEDATIIFKSIDSNQIKFGGITNKRGYFSIDVEKGLYNATIEFISYKTKKLNLSKIVRDLHIGTIELELNTENLDEVEIVAEKNALELKLNKKVYNVGKDFSSNSATATEILSNLPSVSVDLNGKVTLRGQSNVTVLVNGKFSSMSKSEALKSLPAGSIEKVVVLTNPGARYRASSSGIINIILKKGKNNGLNASLTTSAGYKDYYGGLLTLNHKSKKINFFTNTSYLKRNPISIVSLENEYFNNGITSSFLNENRENYGGGNVFLSTVGMEFFLSKKTTLITSINYTNINTDNKTNTFTNIFNASKTQTSSNNRFNDGVFTDEIVEFVIDFEQGLKKEGQKIVSSFSYSKDIERYDNVFSNTNTNFINENYIENNTINNTIFDIKFLNPINETSEYEIGYLGEFGKLPFTYLSASTNEIINYTDNVHSIYLNFSKQAQKFYYELGLRAEFSEYIIDYASLNVKQKKPFNDVFPSFYIEYNATDTHSMNLSYRRGIIRPSYAELQPFEQRVSETITYIGNENIDPIYLDMADYTYMFNGKNITFSSSLFFNSYNNYRELVTYETDEAINGINKIITTPINMGKLEQFGIAITSIVKANSWLSFTGNLNLYDFEQTGTFEYTNSNNETFIQNYRNSNFTGSLSFQTKMKLPKIINFQTSIQHELESEAAFRTRKAYTFVSAAISKDLFHKNASLSLSSNDLFNSIKIKRNRNDIGYFSKGIKSNKYQTIILSFTYRFNQNKQDRIINFDKKEIKSKF